MPSAKAIRALSHTFRQKMLSVLAEGRITYSGLLSKLEPRGSDRGRFNYHLRVLREAGLVRVVEGLYVLNPSGKAGARFLRELSENPDPPRKRSSSLAVVWSVMAATLLGATALVAVVFSNVPTPSPGPWSLEDAGWSSPTLIASPLWNIDAQWDPELDLAIDSSGKGLAVWLENDGSRFSVHGRWFVPQVGWSSSMLIHVSSSRLDCPQVATDTEGSAIVLWLEDSGRHMSSYHVPGVGWGTPSLVQEKTFGCIADLGISPFGDAFAVWKECTRTSGGVVSHCDVLVRRFDPRTGWSPSERIDLDGSHPDRAPRVAVDRLGNALVVWEHNSRESGPEPEYTVWANRYLAGYGWGAPTFIGGGANHIWLSELATDPHGGAVALWTQRDLEGKGYSLHANMFTPDVGWGDSAAITSEGRPEVGLRREPGLLARGVAIDARGYAIALWEKREAKGVVEDWVNYTMSLHASRYLPGMGWDEAVLVGRVDMYEPYQRPYCNAFAGDRDGNAIVLWQDQGNPLTLDPPSIYASRFVPGLGWSATIPLGPASAPRLFRGCPEVALDPKGDGLAIWGQADEAGNAVYANRFIPTSTTDQLLREVGNALEYTNLRLAAFESRLLFLAGLGLALAALTGFLFVLQWNLRRALKDEVSEDSAEPPGGVAP